MGMFANYVSKHVFVFVKQKMRAPHQKNHV